MASGIDTDFTIFTTCKPLIGLDLIMQENAVASWRAAGFPVIIIGDEDGAAALAKKYDCTHIPEVARSAGGLPLIPDLFAKAANTATTACLGYLNSDILIDETFAPALHALQNTLSPTDPFLATCRRRYIPLLQALDFADGKGVKQLKEIDQKAGSWDHAHSIDAFFFNRGWLTDIPALSVGRVFWDTWMLANTLKSGAKLIDLSPTTQIYHPLHDYKVGNEAAVNILTNPGSVENKELADSAANNIADSATHYLEAATLKPVNTDSRNHHKKRFAPDRLKQFAADISLLFTDAYDRPNLPDVFIKTIIWRADVFLPYMEVTVADASDREETLSKARSLCAEGRKQDALDCVHDYLLKGLIDRLESLGDRSLLIWGSSIQADRVANWLLRRGLPLQGFADSFIAPNSGQVKEVGDQDYPIFAPAEIEKMTSRPYVIVGSMFVSEIEKTLIALGFKADKDYIF